MRRPDDETTPPPPAPQPSAGQLFISYARKNLEIAEKLTADLERAGFNVWLDRKGIDGGSKWAAEIARAIAGCETFLLLLSPDSVASDNVRKECDLAAEDQRRMLPVIIQAVPQIPPELRYHLAGLQRIDCATDYQRGIADLLRALGTAATPKPTASPAPTTPTSPSPTPKPAPTGNLQLSSNSKLGSLMESFRKTVFPLQEAFDRKQWAKVISLGETMLKEAEVDGAMRKKIAMAYEETAREWMAQKQITQAIDALTRAIEICPEGSYEGGNYRWETLLPLRGAAYQVNDDFDSAIEDYSRVIEHIPSAGIYGARGKALLVIGAFEAAAEDFTQAIERSSQKGHYYLCRAHAYRGLGQGPAASQDLTDAADNGVSLARAYQREFEEWMHSTDLSELWEYIQAG